MPTHSNDAPAVHFIAGDYQAISTTYHGPTNTRGSRISAVTESGMRASIPYDHALNSYDCHKKAAAALCAKLKWHGTLAGGATKRGYVFVFVEMLTKRVDANA